MKFKKALSISTLLPLLLSCSNQKSPSFDYETFPFKREEGVIDFTRNGDNFPKSGFDNPYEDLLRPLSLKDMIQTIEDGRSLFLFLHIDGCRHCEEAHNNFTAYLISSLVEATSVYFDRDDISRTTNILAQLAKRYPSYSKYLNGSYQTPTIFFLQDEETINYVSFFDNLKPLQNLYGFFNDISALNNVFNFRTYDAFSSFVATYDCMAIMDEDSYEVRSEFYECIYPSAKDSPKFTAHVETDKLSDEDKASFSKYFSYQGRSSYLRIKKGKATALPGYESCLEYYD